MMNGHVAGPDLEHANLLIVGLARNCEKRLRGDVLTILHAVSHAHSLSWLIVESDSTDRTLHILSELKEEIPCFQVLSLGALRGELPLRTERIARCRNIYLAELRSNPLYVTVDYVVVVDLDGVNQLLSKSSMASCWTRAGWDVCTANQRGPYYDIWALRHSVWSPADCWQQYDFLVAHGTPPEQARYAAVYSKMITVDEDSEWIEVESAFGGLAIYSRAALAGVQYVGVSDTGDPICEHIGLHRQIKANGGRVFINPRLINARYTGHSLKSRALARHKRFYGRLLTTAMRMIRAKVRTDCRAIDKRQLLSWHLDDV